MGIRGRTDIKRIQSLHLSPDRVTPPPVYLLWKSVEGVEGKHQDSNDLNIDPSLETRSIPIIALLAVQPVAEKALYLP